MESLKLRLQNAIPVNGVSVVSSEAGVMVGCNGETYFLPSGKDEWVKVENIPAVNVNCHTPAKRGRWTNGECKCPVCGEDKFKDLDADIWSDWKPPFCPNCGADMRGEEKTTDRLTKRGSFTQRNVDKLLDLTEDNPMGRTEAYIKLQQYEDLEEDGIWNDYSIVKPTDEGKYYLVYKKFGNIGVYTLAQYANDLYNVDNFEFDDKKGKNGFYYFDNDHGYLTTDCMYWSEIVPPKLKL